MSGIARRFTAPVASSRQEPRADEETAMTPLSRWGATAALVAACAAGAGMAVPAHAQDVALVRVRVDADDVVLRNGQAYYLDARGGRYERVSIDRDRNGLPVYYRVVRRPRYDAWYGWPSATFDDDYRPPARRVDCSSSGNCTVKYYDPRYDRRLYRAGYGDGYRGDRRDRGDHGDRGDRGSRGDRDDD